jgi:NAD(P)-dependent dehydrogenase (short-subunit alcohol dehydrogenase family)
MTTLSTVDEYPWARPFVVTGAASGIGRATAAALAAAGAPVLCVDRDADGLATVVAEIAAAGGTAAAHLADLADPDACAAAIAAGDALGPLGGLVNVAGVMSDHDTVEHLDDATLSAILAVNVAAVFRLGRHAIPRLRAAGGGVIVNVSSVHAFASMPGAAAYAASKGALVALTRAMAIDLAPDRVRVVGVAPGSVDTPLSRRDLDARGLSFAEAGFPTEPGAVGRVAAPEEIAGVIAWAASPAAAVVNGTTLVADAALLAHLV